MEFRTALAEKIGRETRLEVDPDRELTVTCGSTEAMLASFMAILNPGDRVAVFSPFYENYAADGILSGAEAVHVPLHAPDWGFDLGELRSAFRDKGCRALVLCNPSNPCGKVFSREELVSIGAVPGSSFFERPVKNLVRFHFSRRESTLREAAYRLKLLPSKL
jgi:aminotransferase